MKTYLAIHEHQFGTTEYVVHATNALSEGEIESHIPTFEEGKGEYVVIYDISDTPDIVINN